MEKSIVARLVNLRDIYQESLALLGREDALTRQEKFNAVTDLMLRLGDVFFPEDPEDPESDAGLDGMIIDSSQFTYVTKLVLPASVTNLEEANRFMRTLEAATHTLSQLMGYITVTMERLQKENQDHADQR